MRLLACLIVAPQRGYDEPAILSYAISSFCPTSADGLQPALNSIADLFNWRGPDLLLIVWFAHDRGFIGPILVLFIFVLVIIFIVRISRWCRVACDSENLVDASNPLLLQTSMKLYGIHGHVVLLLTFVFERWTRSDSSPSASAQYISASFRHWRLCRGDFATAARRANFRLRPVILYFRPHRTDSG